LMVEFLGIAYTSVILAAAVPAFMHFYGVFAQVHFEAKRSGLRGLTAAELPNPLKVLREGWQTLMPLAALLTILFSGYTPSLAAFWGITACMVVGLARVPAITVGYFAALAVAVAFGVVTQLWFSVPMVLFAIGLGVAGWLRDDRHKALVIDVADGFVV